LKYKPLFSFGLLFIFISVVFVSGCSINNGSTYSDDSITFQYPDGWEVKNISDTLVVNNNILGNIPAITFKNIPVFINTNQFNNSQLKGLYISSPKNPDIEVYIFENNNVTDQSAELFKGSYTDANRKMYAETGRIIITPEKRTFIYYLVFKIPEQNYNETKSDFQLMYSTFNIKKI